MDISIYGVVCSEKNIYIYLWSHLSVHVLGGGHCGVKNRMVDFIFRISNNDPPLDKAPNLHPCCCYCVCVLVLLCLHVEYTVNKLPCRRRVVWSAQISATITYIFISIATAYYFGISVSLLPLAAQLFFRGFFCLFVEFSVLMLSFVVRLSWCVCVGTTWCLVTVDKKWGRYKADLITNWFARAWFCLSVCWMCFNALIRRVLAVD